VRRKTDGVQRFEKAKGLLATEVVHTTSRLGKDQDEHGIPDPQLHSHIVLIAAERKDGQMAAIESKQLYRSARENGAWYRSELAANLKELGLSIERHQGTASATSASGRQQGPRRALVNPHPGRAPRRQHLPPTLRPRAPARRARLNRPLHPRIEDRRATGGGNAAWRALGEEHNQTPRRSEEAFHDWGLHNDPNIDLAKELLANATKEASMITTHELHAKAYELSAGVCRPTHADQLIDDLAREGELLQLEDGTWTTRQLRELEQTTLDITERRAVEIAAPVSEQSLKQARREIGRQIKGSLTQEQRDALQTITGESGIAVLVGPAGTGKGVVISTAARAWQLEGIEVIGTSVAGATAQRLQNEASLDRSYSADELNYGIKDGRIRIGPNTVIVFDEAAMADHDRIAPLVKLTAERGAKPLLVGDAAQLSSIGPSGLFAALEGKVPTAELHEIHRANHEWERQAWQQIRAGEPGPALAQYQAHDRLHIHDTRARAAEAMVQNWDETRKTFSGGQAVMITDASNLERDQMNAMAQERRAQAGELGAHTVELPGKPYGLRAGDEIIFTAKFPVPGQERIKNGITATVIDTSRHEDKITIKPHEHEPRDVQIDTSKFSDLSLSYAVHVNKAQGITAETSGILIGGWQTDKEHAYVTVSRAREQTQIYLSREDLGEKGLDIGAVERLGEKMKHSRAQQATITKKTAERDETLAPQATLAQQTTEHDTPSQRASTGLDPHRSTRQQPRRRRIEDDRPIPRDQFDQSRDKSAENAAPQPAARTNSNAGPTPIDIRDAIPGEGVRITEREFGDIKIAHTQAYDLHSYTGKQTYVLFGAWQTDTEQGFVIAADGANGPENHTHSEERREQNIAAELKDRVSQAIEQIHAREATTRETNTHQKSRETNTPQKAITNETSTPAPQPAQLEPGKTPHEQPAQLEPVEHDTDTARNQENDTSRDHDRQPDHEPVGRDPYIEQAIQDARDRQQAWENGIDPDHDNDRGFGIE
jgi:AAA domain/TrwC relaxase